MLGSYDRGVWGRASIDNYFGWYIESLEKFEPQAELAYSMIGSSKNSEYYRKQVEKGGLIYFGLAALSFVRARLALSEGDIQTTFSKYNRQGLLDRLVQAIDDIQMPYTTRYQHTAPRVGTTADCDIFIDQVDLAVCGNAPKVLCFSRECKDLAMPDLFDCTRMSDFLLIPCHSKLYMLTPSRCSIIPTTSNGNVDFQTIIEQKWPLFEVALSFTKHTNKDGSFYYTLDLPQKEVF